MNASTSPLAWLPEAAHPAYARIVARRLAHGGEIYPDVIASVARAIHDAVELQRQARDWPVEAACCDEFQAQLAVASKRARRYAVAEAARKAAAERAKRRYRRRRAGIRIVPVEIDAGTPDDPGTIDLLIARGLITAEARSDVALLAFEIGALLASIAEEGKVSRVRVPPETVPPSRQR